jgi:EmrB/QacA subfamily drug resistance transporter
MAAELEPAGAARPGAIVYGSPHGRGVLLATIVASGMAFLDSTVVNVALPVIGRSLGAGLPELQWTLDAYLLTLTALLLPAGAIADRIGRRRVFIAGVASFAATSALCAAAPGPALLAAARAVQGVAAALLVPGSLAILRASFREEDVGRAIGAWAALSGMATAAGPLAGGWLAGALSWRAIFLVNLPFAAVAIAAAHRCVPESRVASAGRIDVAGAALATAGLGGLTFALIEGGARGGRGAAATAVAGAAALAAFLAVEARRRDPMLPLSLFGVRAFSVVNALTLAVYFALSGAMFLTVLQLQLGLGWSPLAAGAALLPVTFLLLVLSPVAARAAAAGRTRAFLAGGPIACGAGLALLARIAPGAAYLPRVLPGVLVLGLGLAATVAPLTTAALEAAPPERAGVASAVNNAVARLAGLLAVAALPLAGGISPADVARGGLGPGYRTALGIAACIAAAGGVLAGLMLRGPGPRRRAPRAGAPAGARARRPPARRARTHPRRRGRGAPPGSRPRG